MPKRSREGRPSPAMSDSASSSGSSRHSFTSSRQGSSDEIVQQLCSIFSDIKVEAAKHLLEACNWDLHKAAQLHLEHSTGVATSTDIPEHANRFDSLVIDSDDDSEIPLHRARRTSPITNARMFNFFDLFNFFNNFFL